MFTFEIEKIETKKNTASESFLQSPFWCGFKGRHGWKTLNFSVRTFYPEEDGSESCGNGKTEPSKTLENFEVTVLNRSFAKGLFSLNYVPLMPHLPFLCTDEKKIALALGNDGSESGSSENRVSVIDEEIVTPETQTIEFANFLSDFSKALKPFLPKNSLFIRFDPDVSFSSLDERETFNYGLSLVSFADRLHLCKCRNDIQPADTVVLDLSKSEDELLSSMHSKWRYNIRLSEKKGVEVKRYLGSDEKIEEKIEKFFELTKETNERDGNASHGKNYYLDLAKSSSEERDAGLSSPLVSLYIAESEGEEIASIMTLFSENEAVYLYGASSNRKRNLMPNHLLQWTAIKDAKSYGSKAYDMYGIPPEGEDSSHPMHGLYMFKTNFGGKIIHRTGSWDFPFSFLYRFYRAAENTRAFWHKKVLKKIRGR